MAPPTPRRQTGTRGVGFCLMEVFKFCGKWGRALALVVGPVCLRFRDLIGPVAGSRFDRTGRVVQARHRRQATSQDSIGQNPEGYTYISGITY